MLNKNTLRAVKKVVAKQSKYCLTLEMSFKNRADISLQPSRLVKPRSDIKLRPNALVRIRTNIKLWPIGLVRSYKDRCKSEYTCKICMYICSCINSCMTLSI